MKTLAFKHHLFYLCIAMLVSITAGCGRLVKEDLPGSYVRFGNGITDRIVIYTNGHFDQSVAYTNGSSWSTTGTWEFKGGIVELSDFYSAFDFEHKSITIPPQGFAFQSLWVRKLSDGKIRLSANNYEPMWFQDKNK